MTIRESCSLKKYNTFGVEAKAKYFTEIKSPEELLELNKLFPLSSHENLIIGAGSNILFTKDIEGLVAKISIDGVDELAENEDFVYYKVGAGVNWHKFVMRCIEKNLGGLENLSLIPGNVGTAPMQNIGAYGVEQDSCFEELEAINRVSGEKITFKKEACQFGYRTSIFKTILKGQYIITSVTYRLSKKPELNTSYGAIRDTLNEMEVSKPNVKNVSDAVIKIRKGKLPDPSEIGNAGSFFKNPLIDTVDYEGLKAEFQDIPGFKVSETEMKIPAAWLIDKSGWKGFREGEIGVHKNQALVLVNYGNGSGAKIRDLAFHIKKDISTRFGIELEPEVNII